MLSNFLLIYNILFLLLEKKLKVKLALAVPTGAPTTLVNEMIDTPPLVVPKTIKPCLCNQEE